MAGRGGANVVRSSVALTLGAGMVAAALVAGLSYAALGGYFADRLFDRFLPCVVVLLGIAAVVAWLSARETAGDVRRLARGVATMVRDEAWGEAAAVPSRDELGELTTRLERLRLHLLQSLEREREARRRAEEADRFKTEFLTTVSHELRTPLNSILGFADVLLQELEGPLTDDQRQDLQTIHNAGKHLVSLFDGVLDLSAAASGHLQLERRGVDARATLEEVAAELRGQLQDRELEVRAETCAQLPAVHADPTRLRQVLTNLGSNAIKFTERGEVVLGARPEADHVLLWVRDTGPGIAPDRVAAIFEEFGQAGGTSRQRGAGLGLAISRQLVELHGGELTVDSVPGRGSTFCFQLPQAPSDREAT